MTIQINFESLISSAGINAWNSGTQQSTLILTPNSRTQKAVIAGFMANYSRNDIAYSPNVLAFESWVALLWQNLSFYTELPSIINDLEVKLWLKEQVANDPNWQLSNELGIAEKILESHKVLIDWNLSVDHFESIDTPEQAYFVNLSTLLSEYLNNNQVVLAKQKLSLIEQHFEHLLKSLPEKIILAGFNQLTPQTQQFLEKLSVSGIEITQYFPQVKPQSISKFICRDEPQEIEYAAALAKHWSNEKPNQSIAVVVNQLSSKIDWVQRYFSEHFHPEENQPNVVIQKSQYNVSVGQTLAEIPEVVVALNILQMNREKFDLATLNLLKSSPFIQWGNEENIICGFLHEQIQKGLANYRIDYLIKAIDNHENVERLGLLKKRLESVLERAFSKREMNVWKDVWFNQLQTWGWGSLDETELSATVESFLQSLKSLCVISDNYQSLSVKQALEIFTQQLKQTSFQIPSDRTNVHVLGVLEATGLIFDKAIMVGFNRDNWPQKIQPSPFIPLEVQRINQMPNASAEREFNYTESLSNSLLASAKNIVIADVYEDQQSQVSLFFSEYQYNNEILDDLNLIKRKATPNYEWIVDEKIDIPKGKIKGGAYLLSHYATCPFKALTAHLFKLESAPEITEGVSAMTRGSWLHLAMELLWCEIQTNIELNKIEQSDLNNKVMLAVAQARQKYETDLYANASEEVIEIENNKIINQIIEWLNIDKNKPAFSAKAELEKTLTLEGLNFNFKVDRIDTYEDGSQEIIDFKTGKVDIKKWMGARPEEAQMPAYVIAMTDAIKNNQEQFNLNALTYAKIKTGEILRTGIQFDSDNKPYAFSQEPNGDEKKARLNINELLMPLAEVPKQNLIENWRKNLTDLATNMQQGNMPVSPKFAVKSCEYCEYAGFCRIGENQPSAEVLGNNKAERA